MQHFFEKRQTGDRDGRDRERGARLKGREEPRENPQQPDLKETQYITVKHFFEKEDKDRQGTERRDGEGEQGGDGKGNPE